MKHDITFITGNAHKKAILEKFFPGTLKHQKLDLPEIQSVDLETVAVEKAKRAYEILGTPVLVEDVGLVFCALGELPGPFVKWFVQSIGDDGLVGLLDGHQDRRARAEFCYVLYDENGPKVFQNSVDGRIADKPGIPDGFGWNAIFIADGYEKTLSEMGTELEVEASLRKPALESFQAFLLSKESES